MRVARYLTLICTASAAIASSASAANFSYVGDFTKDNDVSLFTFVVDAPSEVTLRSYSWAGGTNAAGATIAAGGFDPILTLYDAAGLRISSQDDGTDVPIDSGRAFDVNYVQALAAGTYTVALTQYDNFGGATLSDAFDYATQPNFTADACGVSGGSFLSKGFGDCLQRDSHWAFDLLNVAQVTTPSVPEPATWAMFIGGFGMIGGSMRSRRRTNVRFA